MQNLYLPYELSLLAKQKGFDEPSLWYYLKSIETDKHSNHVTRSANPNHFMENWNSIKTRVSAPLYQQMVDWLRIKKGIHIRLEPANSPEIDKGYFPKLHYVKESIRFDSDIALQYDGINNNFLDRWNEWGYYQALENAIEEALKLI